MRKANRQHLTNSYPGDLLPASASRVHTRHPSLPGPEGGQGAGLSRGMERTLYFRIRPLPETPSLGFPWLPGICAVPGAWLREIAPPPRPDSKMESLGWGSFRWLCQTESLSGDSSYKLGRNSFPSVLPLTVMLPFSKY